MNKKTIQLIVNGKEVERDVYPNLTLLDLLRSELGLTGTKNGCNQGECGACTVILDGAPINSCLKLAVEADGSHVTTIEGIVPTRGTHYSSDGLHPLQESFIEHDALQCGFCTPGQIMSAKALLDRKPSPSENEVKKFLAGNLCRCGCYPNIVKATLAAAEKMRRGETHGTQD